MLGQAVDLRTNETSRETWQVFGSASDERKDYFAAARMNRLRPIRDETQQLGLIAAPGVPLSLAAKQVTERYLTQHLIHDVLHRLPERANRAIDRVRAEFCHPGVQAAKTGLEETSTEPGQHLTDIDVIPRSRQLVSTGLTADTLDEPTPTQRTHQLGDVGNR